LMLQFASLSIELWSRWPLNSSRWVAMEDLYNTPLLGPCRGYGGREYPVWAVSIIKIWSFSHEFPFERSQIYVSTSRRIFINGGLMPRLIVIGDFNQNTRFSISFETIWEPCAWWDNSTYHSLPDTMISVPENHEYLA
jgi:hypothetical protein